MKMLFGIAIVMAICNNAAYSQAINHEYSKEIIARLPWGKAPGEIGIFEVSAGSIFSNPLTFAVDGDENIYLLDGRNHRIQVFDMSGEITDLFQIDDTYSYRDSYMQIDDEQQLYIHLSREKLFNVYTLNGKLVKSISYTGQITSNFTIDNLIIWGGTGFLSLDESRIVQHAGSGGEDVYRIAEDEAEEALNRYYHTGKYTKRTYSFDSDLNLSLSISDDTGPVTVLKLDELLLDYPAYIYSFWGETVNHDIILGGIPFRNKERPYITLECDEQFEKISIIHDSDFRKHTRYSTLHPMQIMPDGTIYTLYVDSDGAIIYKWRFLNK